MGMVSIWRLIPLIGVLFPLQGCDTPTRPRPPTTTTTTSVPPPVRVDEPFSFDGNIGFSLFAGARASDTQIAEVFRYAQSRLGGRPFARVCGELQSWPSDRPWLPRGSSAVPFDDTAPAYQELKNFLDVAATIPRAQVLLVPICNLKEDGTGPADREKWVRTVARLASGYANVALEVVNEYRHPNSDITSSEMVALLRAAKAECMACLVGTDSSFNPNRTRYDSALRPYVDYFSAHPWRNPDPTRAEIRRMVSENGGFLVLSETTAYDGMGLSSSGLVTQSQDQIVAYLRNCQAVPGCIFTYHSLWGLGWPEMPLGWIPSGS